MTLAWTPALLQRLDGITCPLGPEPGWPESLRSVLALVLPAAAPIAVFWGVAAITFYNDAFARCLLSPNDNSLGRPLRETGLGNWTDFAATIERVRHTGQTAVLHDCYGRCATGALPEQPCFDLSCSAIPDNGLVAAAEPGARAAGGVLCIGAETSLSQVATRRLDEMAELLRIAQKNGGVGAFQWWPDAEVIDASDACRAIYGLDRTVVVTSGLLNSLSHPDDAEASARLWRKPPGSPMRYSEYRIRRPDTGEERWLGHAAEWVPQSSSRDRIVGTVTDITPQKQAEAALRTSEAGLQAVNATLEQTVAERTRERDRLWHVSQDAFVVFDLEFNHVSVSPAFERLLGWPAHEVVGNPSRGLIHPDDLERTRRVRTQLQKGRTIRRYENRVLHRDGSWHWMAWTAVPDGDRIYAIARDITKVKAHVHEIAAANRALRAQIEAREQVEATLRQMQRLEAVGQLTAGIAHDFNNLLTVIVGNLEYLARGSGSPTEQRRIAMMQAAAARGAELTAQLLAFSRRQRLNAQAVNLNDTVAGMRDLLNSFSGGTVRLLTVPAPLLWPALVDPAQIELVIVNLVINARDALVAGGTVTITTANVTLTGDETAVIVGTRPSPGDYVMVAVADNGTGMTSAVAAKAFEPFFTTKAVGRGSGLGLAQVYGFARQSGGGVMIDTAAGHGTTVRVYLPRASSEPAPVGAPTPAGTAPAFDGRSRRVLLVDDDDAVREVARSILQECHFDVTEAASGREALEAFDSAGAGFDLVVLDFAMPEMNGAEVAQALRRRQPEVRIIFITGYAEVSALRATDKAYVLQKPFREAELQAMLVRALAAVPPDSVTAGL